MAREKQGFDTDHSSQTYEYYSEKKLSNEEIVYLKSRAPSSAKFTKNKMKIFVHGEGYPRIVTDSEITAKYFTCMISEDYEWVTCEIVIDYDKDIFKELEKYVRDEYDHSLSVDRHGSNVLISACVHIDWGAIDNFKIFKGLRKLFLEIRGNILKGKYEELELLAKYCEDPKSINGFIPKSEQVKKLKECLDTYW